MKVKRKNTFKKEFKRLHSEMLSRKSKNPVSGIYLITCNKNDKIYIGSSIDIDRRWAMHKLSLQFQSHHNYKIQNDFNEFGLGSFTFEVLKKIEGRIGRDELYLIEQIYINKHLPEYNISKQVNYSPPPGRRSKLFSRHRKTKKHKLHK